MYKDITGAILTGGESRRMGRDKAAIEIDGLPLIKINISLFKSLFGDLFVVTKEKGRFGDIGCREVVDRFGERGAMIGVLTALEEAKTDYVFVAACDMPFLNGEVINLIVADHEGFDVILPRICGKGDPLHALYSKKCLNEMLHFMEHEGKSLNRFIESLSRDRVKVISEEEIKKIDPEAIALFNMNTPEELNRAKTLSRINSKKPD